MKQKTNNKKIVLIVLCGLVLVIMITVSMVSFSASKRIDSIQQKLELAERYLNELDYEQAIAAYKSVLEIDPKNVDAYKGLIQAYNQKGCPEEAILMMIEGYEQTNDELFLGMLADWYLAYGDELIENELYDEAIKVLDEGYERTRDSRIEKKRIEIENILNSIYCKDTLNTVGENIDQKEEKINEEEQIEEEVIQPGVEEEVTQSVAEGETPSEVDGEMQPAVEEAPSEVEEEMQSVAEEEAPSEIEGATKTEDEGDTEQKENVEEAVQVNSEETAMLQTIDATPVGSCLVFGKYEQDNNMENGPEPIEWIVLAKDGSRALLLSRYVLDNIRFHNEYKIVYWQDCSLREWLSSSFYSLAFSDDEKARICISTNENPKFKAFSDNKEPTEDKVFCMNCNEVELYLSYGDNWIGIPTKYAESMGVKVTSDQRCDWWLRTPGRVGSWAMYVSTKGTMTDKDVYYENNTGVRPAMWISY